MSQIIIEPKWMNLIKSVLAFPAVDELLLSEEQIKDYCIFPSLQKYFTKFPIPAEYTAAIQDETFVAFPDELTFGVLDARTVDIGIAGGNGGGFYDILIAQSYNNNSISTRSTGAYGKRRYNPSGLMNQRDMDRQNLKSQQNQYTTIKSRVDYPNRQLIAYASMAGTLNITWAKYSNNFEDVRYERKNDVVKLCQAELMLHLANSAAILVDSALEVSINIDYLKDMAQGIFTDIQEKWDSIPDIILLHQC